MTPGGTADLLAPSIANAVAPSERAPAKVNLALHVTGRRADGYHDLHSLVVFAGIADTLTVAPPLAPGIALEVGGPFADRLAATTPAEANLVHAVADALMRTFPERAPDGVRLVLEKRLPLAAGLGGGSADAAATLRLLNRAWRLGLTTEQLGALGAAIGADVAVCVHARPAEIGGIGEVVTPVTTLPEIPMVLVNPGAAVDTAGVFRRLRGAARSPLPPLPAEPLGLADLVAWLRTTRNDLFEPACAVAPVIERTLRMVASHPDCMLARMSGSGATVFGIFPTDAAAEAAAARFRHMRPGGWTVASRTGAA